MAEALDTPSDHAGQDQHNGARYPPHLAGRATAHFVGCGLSAFVLRFLAHAYSDPWRGLAGQLTGFCVNQCVANDI
jgi:hypothetical protein